MRVVHVGRFYFKEDWQSYYEIIDNLKYLIPILEIKQMIGKKVNEKIIFTFEKYFEKKKYLSKIILKWLHDWLLVSSLVTIAQSKPVALRCKRHNQRKKPHCGQNYNCYHWTELCDPIFYSEFLESFIERTELWLASLAYKAFRQHGASDQGMI